MPKISVIIPVYNAQEYLSECLDSVLSQTLSDIEIICINDGSTDNSLEILKEYAKKDERIKIINQRNKGVSVARNKAIKKAQGKYIAFLDSDDFVKKDTYEKCIKKINATNSDILIFGMELLINNEYLPARVNSFMEEKEDAFEIPPQLLTYSVHKIYKTEFIKNNKIDFPKGIKSAEDGVFCQLCNFYKPKYTIIKDSFYVYRKNQNSQTEKNAKYCIKTDLQALKFLTKTRKFKTSDDETKKTIINKFFGGIIHYWENYPQHKNQYLIDIQAYFLFIKNFYDLDTLKTIQNFYRIYKIKEIKETYFKALEELSSIEKIFSLTNNKGRTHKILTILGLKLKFRRKNV